MREQTEAAPVEKLTDKLTPTETLERAKHDLGSGWFNFISCRGSSLSPQRKMQYKYQQPPGNVPTRRN